MEHQSLIDSDWATSDNNRRAKFYRLTAAGTKRLRDETKQWSLVSSAVANVLNATAGKCDMLARLSSFARALAHRRKLEAELDAEMRFHSPAFEDDLIRSGADPQQARRRARIEFGSMERLKEECREELGVSLTDEFACNVRYACVIYFGTALTSEN